MRNLLLKAGLFLFSFFFIGLSLSSPSFFVKVDQIIYHFFCRWNNPGWLALNHYLSFLGQGEILCGLAFIIGLFLFFNQHRWEGIWFFVSFSSFIAINFLVKLFFGRIRPLALDEQFFLQTYSFPSGHASGSLVFYALLFLILQEIYPRFFNNKYSRLFLALLIITIGFTRLFLGVHWFFDVIGGYLLGGFWICLNLILAKKYFIFTKHEIL